METGLAKNLILEKSIITIVKGHNCKKKTCILYKDENTKFVYVSTPDDIVYEKTANQLFLLFLCFIISASVSVSSTDTTIPCTVSNASFTGFSLIWRFNHSQIILNQTRANVSHPVSEDWRQQVKGVSESGSLRLQNLSLKQEGTYTCELSDEEETYVSNTFLKIMKGKIKSV